IEVPERPHDTISSDRFTNPSPHPSMRKRKNRTNYDAPKTGGNRVGPWSRVKMSALGHKQTYAVQQSTFALPPIATAKADAKRWLDAGCATDRAPLFTAEILSSEQVARYNELRGYQSDANPHQNHKRHQQ